MNKIDSFRGSYYFLSNFFEISVTYDGITYQNNEAAFQAQKCLNYEDRKQFSHLNPIEAKHLGRRVSLRPDWERVKMQEMTNIVHEKFEQNKDLGQKLLDTDSAYLEEGNNWGDRIWGTVNGNGQNLLGQILMEEREKIKEQTMENKCRHTNTTVSLINYHFVFCPRYRRKIFLIPNVEKRFKELVEIKCKELEIEIITIECNIDYSYMFLNCSPTLSPSDIMQQIKDYTSIILKEEFNELSQMPNLWTKNYFVSTDSNVRSESIKKYVKTQVTINHNVSKNIC